MRSLEELISSRVKFKQLTNEEIKSYTNGCGPQKSWLKVPQFCFNASCCHHDWNYTIGGEEKDRKKADYQFYKEMLNDALRYKSKFLIMIKYLTIAWIYYISVRLGGKKCYNYRKL